MKIAVLILAHGDEAVLVDTLLSIRKHATEDILTLVDGSAWNWGKGVNLPSYKLQGLIHGHYRNPYRNVAFGLWNCLKLFPKADWYCCTEYDVLFASDEFKEDLTDAWCLGTNMKRNLVKLPAIEKLVKKDLEESRYLLGCCIFYSQEFLKKLQEQNFFERFLNWTNCFSKGFFPGLEKHHDLSENLYPTLAHNLGGEVKELSSWTAPPGLWTGNFRRYPMRWRPELDPIEENFPEASIMHPIKTWEHPIRHLRRIKK